MTDKWWHDVDITGLGLERGKHACISCSSSDAMHVYETHAYCFSCGRNFDAPDILMAQTGCTFVEALTQLKGTRARPRNPQRDLAHMFQEPTPDEEINAEFDPPFPLPDNPWNVIGDRLINQPLCQTSKAWLKSRGLSPEMCHGLGVRSMHPRHWGNVKSLIGGEAAARQAGIVADSKKSGRTYTLPWFSYPWILLPYTDAQFFWTTVRHRATHDTDEPKILSPAGAQPSPLPYLAMHATEQLARQGGALWVVEGETDALSLWQIGEVAVASPGASVWLDEWREWLKSVQAQHPIVIMGDGDEAGEGFVRRVSRGMSPSGVTRALWDADCDANDLLVSEKLEREIKELLSAKNHR